MLNKRIKLCDCAQALVERVLTMKGDELHKTLQPLVDADIELPLAMKLKLCHRRCQEVMEQNPKAFLSYWAVWNVSGVAIAADDEDDGSFSPLVPRLKAVCDALTDKDMQLDQKMRNEEFESQAAFLEAKQSLSAELKAGRGSWLAVDVCLFHQYQYLYQATFCATFLNYP